MTEDKARKVYSILVEHCGATAHAQNADDFVFHMERGCREYRIMGDLGFGGRLYRSGAGLRVGCYREDETAERVAMINAANEALSAYEEKMGGH